jgi:diguanylate cyclase (GGDEF)-like protein
MIENYKKFGIEFTVLMLDIDHFKLINDTYGHPYRDKVLVIISNVLTKTLRETDYIGRYRGEEFIAIFPNTKKDKAKEIVERILLIFYGKKI